MGTPVPHSHANMGTRVIGGPHFHMTPELIAPCVLACLNLTIFRGFKVGLALQCSESYEDKSSNNSLDTCTDSLPPEIPYLRIVAAQSEALNEINAALE